MTRRYATLAGSLVLAGLGPACAATPRCATVPTGAVVRWADVPVDPARPFAVLPVSVQAPANADGAEPTVFLRFDTAALVGSPMIERAALLLVPSRGPVRERCALLRVRAVDEPWSAVAIERGERPALSPDGVAEVSMPPQRVPVRVDVTALARALGPDGLRRLGLAVIATEGGVAFRGSGTLSAEERPRLEVLLR